MASQNVFAIAKMVFILGFMKLLAEAFFPTEERSQLDNNLAEIFLHPTFIRKVQGLFTNGGNLLSRNLLNKA